MADELWKNIRVEQWHPAKLTLIVAFVTLFMSVLGSVGAAHYWLGKNAVTSDTFQARLDLHKNQISIVEKRMDQVEVDLSGIRMRQLDIWELLKEMRVTQGKSYAISSENNTMLKKEKGR